MTDTIQLAQGGITATGNVAQRLVASGMNVNSLRTNDVLSKDEWVQFDETVVQIARSRLVAVGALVSMGLVYRIDNGLGTTVLEWEKVSDMSPANVSMSGVTPGDRDRMLFTLMNMPLPITHKEFQINIRNLLATRRGGSRLDTTQAALAARLVAESIEKSLYDGVAITSGGSTIYGLTNHPDRNTDSLTGDWSQSAQSGEDIVGDVLKMMGDLADENMYGPYELHVPRDYWNKLQADFKTNSDRTIMERLLAVEGVSAVRMSPYLTGGASGEVVLFQTTSDVVDVVEGLQPTTVQWDSEGGMVANFKVMSIMVPRVKSDANSQCGVAHYHV
jgi:uncharacterized linocin/CFP29 family protein